MGGVDVGDGGGWFDGVFVDFFVCEDEVDTFAGFGTGAVEEHFDAAFSAEDGDGAVDEASLFHGGDDEWHVGAADEDVHVAGVAYDGVIDSGDPCGDGVSTDDGVFDVGGFECA